PMTKGEIRTQTPRATFQPLIPPLRILSEVVAFITLSLFLLFEFPGFLLFKTSAHSGWSPMGPMAHGAGPEKFSVSHETLTGLPAKRSRRHLGRLDLDRSPGWGVPEWPVLRRDPSVRSSPTPKAGSGHSGWSKHSSI